MLACATLLHVVQRMRQQGIALSRLRALGLSYWAMVLAHLGVAVFIAGVTLVKTYEVEKDLVLSPGQTENFDGAMLRFDGVRQRVGENYGAWQGLFELTHANGSTVQLMPEKRRYMAGGQVMSEAAIDVGFFGDVYLSMGEPLPAEAGKAQAWTARIYSKPFINWIWWGCCMMALGGVLSIFDRRYKNKKEKFGSQEQGTSQAGV
jgi:cytochrome c-type biogenesis protein CcmF